MMTEMWQIVNVASFQELSIFLSRRHRFLFDSLLELQMLEDERAPAMFKIVSDMFKKLIPLGNNKLLGKER